MSKIPIPIVVNHPNNMQQNITTQEKNIPNQSSFFEDMSSEDIENMKILNTKLKLLNKTVNEIDNKVKSNLKKYHLININVYINKQ